MNEAKVKITGDASDLTKRLNDAQNGLKELGVSGVNCKKELRQLTNQISNLTQQYRSLTDEQKKSPFGTELQQTIQQLTNKAGALKDTMMDVRDAIKRQASDTFVFDAAAQGIQVASNALSAYAAMTGFAGGENKKFKETLEKIAKIQLMANAAISIGNALQRQSALMQGLIAAKDAIAAKCKAMFAASSSASAVAQTQEAAAATTATAAVTAEAVATTEATAAQTAFNVAADANPYGAILAVLGAIIGVVTLFATRQKDATTATAENTKAIEQGKKTLQEYKDKVASTTGEAIGKYEQLRKQYSALKDEHSKTQWINENKKAFEDLGIKVTDLSSAESIFVGNTSKVVAALKARAQAAAAQELYVKAYEDYYKEMEDYNSVQGGAYYTPRTEKNISSADLVKYGLGQGDYTKSKKTNPYTGDLYDAYELTVKGLAKINQAERAAAQERYNNNKKAAQERLKQQTDFADRMASAAQKDINNASDLVDTNTNNTPTRTPKTPKATTANITQEDRAMDKINKTIKEQEALIEELTDKKLKATDTEDIKELDDELRDARKTLSTLKSQKFSLELAVKYGDNVNSNEALIDRIQGQIDQKELELTFTPSEEGKKKLQAEIKKLVEQKEYAVNLNGTPEKKYETSSLADMNKGVDDLTSDTEEAFLAVRRELRDFPFSQRDYKKKQEEVTALFNKAQYEADKFKEENKDILDKVYNSQHLRQIQQELEQYADGNSDVFNKGMNRLIKNKSLDLGDKKLEITEDEVPLLDTARIADAKQAYADFYGELSTYIYQLEDADPWTPMVNGLNNTADAFSQLTSGVFNTVDAVISLTEQWEDMNSWEQFTGVVDTVIMGLSSLASTIEGINSVIHLFSGLKRADAQATAAQTGAMVTQDAAMGTDASVKAADTVANIALAESQRVLTSTLNTAAYASIPFVGPALAAAAQATYEGLWATAAIPMFAEGGIVGGNSLTGDKVLARLNSKEMVLNTRQQGNLFSLLDGQGKSSINSGNVEFTIHGDTLVGILKNQQRKNSRI